MSHNELQTLESALLCWSNKNTDNIEVQKELLSIARANKLNDLATILQSTIDIIQY